MNPDLSMHEAAILKALGDDHNITAIKCRITASLGGSTECEHMGECDKRLIKLNMNVPDPMTDEFQINKFWKCRDAIGEYTQEHYRDTSHEAFAHGLAQHLYSLNLLSKTRLNAFPSDTEKPKNPVETVLEDGCVIPSEVRCIEIIEET